MHSRRAALAGLACSILLTAAAPAAAEETRVTVRVLSRGAKFVGSSMGGVRVTIADADTGQLLATGSTVGSTGDTERIMKTSHPRGAALSTPGSAAFTTALDLDAPRRLRVTASGPLAQLQAANEVSLTQWILPGKHLDGGDGLLLELPGFVLDLASPPAHLQLKGVPQTVELAANLVMMCGCPSSPGGLWNSDGWQVAATIERDGVRVAEVPLVYAGTSSQFAATWTAGEPGTYQVIAWAYDPANGNTGLDRTTFVVNP